MRYTFTNAISALGLNDGITDRRYKVVFHTLRHTFCSWLASKNVPLYTIGTLVGHKNTLSTQLYAKLSPDAKWEALKVIEQKLPLISLDLLLRHILIKILAGIQDLATVLNEGRPLTKMPLFLKRLDGNAAIQPRRIFIQIALMRNRGQLPPDGPDALPSQAGRHIIPARLAHSAKGFNKLLFMRLRHAHSSMHPIRAGTRTAVLMVSSAA